MLLVNIDDVLKITDSNIRHEDKNKSNEEESADEFVFFDTDKFKANLMKLPHSTVMTPEMLVEIFDNSFTKGWIDYSRD